MRNIQLVSLSLSEVCTDDHFYRPYVGHALDNQHEIISNAVGEVRNINDSIDTMAKLAPSMITLSHTTSQVAIPNGWDTSRFSFKLTFTEEPVGSNYLNTYVMTGYTDVLSCNRASEQIDPNTKFFISTVSSTGSTQLSPRPRIKEGYDMLAVAGVSSTKIVNNAPARTIAVIQDRITATSDMTQPEHFSNVMTDSELNASKLEEKTPTGFVKALFDTVQGAQGDSILTSEGHMEMRPHDYQINYTTASIITGLNNAGNGGIFQNEFNASFLDSIDPTFLRSRTNIYLDFNKLESEQFSYTGTEASIATSIHNHLTSIGSGLSVLNASMFITNMVSNRQMQEGITLATGSLHVEVPMFVTSAVVSNDVIHRELILNQFTNRFIREAGPFLTQQGNVFFTAVVEFDRQAVTKISVQLDGSNVMIPFAFGSFASNLISPLLSPENPGENAIVSGIHSSTDSLGCLLKPIEAGYENMARRAYEEVGQHQEMAIGRIPLDTNPDDLPF